jgi:hypothetical protein
MAVTTAMMTTNKTAKATTMTPIKTAKAMIMTLAMI